MRRPSILTDRRGPVDVKMTPMIDVVFLLLVFFIWTASFQIVEYVLPSNLLAVAGEAADPSDVPPPETDFDQIVVRILWTGSAVAWQVNDVPLTSLGQVKDTLEQIAQIKRDAPLILHPDPDVPLGDVIDVYDISRLAGFEKIQFAASQDI
jgi:biopolymer transport protein ExbD